MKHLIEDRKFFNRISLVILIVVLVVNGAFYMKKIIGPLLAAITLVAFLFAAAIRIADQWEKAVVLRLGKFKGLKGTGLVPDHSPHRHHLQVH